MWKKAYLRNLFPVYYFPRLCLLWQSAFETLHPHLCVLPCLLVEIRANKFDISRLTFIADTKLAGNFQQRCSLRQPESGDFDCSVQAVSHLKVFELVC